MKHRYTSISNERLLDYANSIINNEAFEEVIMRVHDRMLGRFRTATAEQREQINAVMDADQAFFEELKKIQAELTDLDEN